MNSEEERQQATAEFERALKEQFESLLAKKDDLYSVREELKDALALVDEPHVTLSSKVIKDTRERITETCKAMWSAAEAIQEELRKKSSEGYDIDDCSLGFYLSEIWLSEHATGDTYEICGSWDSLEDCIARVKEVFSETKVERCVELANQIFHTRLVCKKYFESGSEWPSITQEMIYDIHQTLLFHHGAPTGYRTSHSSNGLGLRYLHFERITECVSVLLKFVNEKMTKDDTLDKRLLLGTLFFERFLWIHPFAEGNGRTARILFSIIMQPAIHLPMMPMFLRAVSSPRELYIHSIRANPRRAPVCLAYYTLNCLIENSKRILDVAPVKKHNLAEADPSLTPREEFYFDELSVIYPSIKRQDIAFLFRKGYLVIVGRKSYRDRDAIVHQMRNMDSVRTLLENQTNMNTVKVIPYSECFPANETLLAEDLVAFTPPPEYCAQFSSSPEPPNTQRVT